MNDLKSSPIAIACPGTCSDGRRCEQPCGHLGALEPSTTHDDDWDKMLADDKRRALDHYTEQADLAARIVTLRVKRLHPDAILPKYATAGAACFDLHAIGPVGTTIDGIELNSATPPVIRTGLAFELPEGHVMLIYSRSGHGFKNSTRLANCTGVIDSDYRGEILVKLTRDNTTDPFLRVRPGDRIAQAMILPVPSARLVEVDELSDTARGTGGFGSTGA